jgi:hypothetical protein
MEFRRRDDRQWRPGHAHLCPGRAVQSQPDRHRQQRRQRHDDGYHPDWSGAKRDAHADGNTDADAFANRHGHIRASRSTHADTDGDTHAGAFANRHGHIRASRSTHAQADAHADAFANRHGYTRADGNTHAQADRNTDAQADGDTHAQADGNTDTQANGNTDAQAIPHVGDRTQIQAASDKGNAQVQANCDTNAHTGGKTCASTFIKCYRQA